MTMTFDESYGYLPTSTLALIRKHNVSPADFDMMLDMFMFQYADTAAAARATEWAAIDEHIVSNSETGVYRPRFF